MGYEDGHAVGVAVASNATNNESNLDDDGSLSSDNHQSSIQQQRPEELHTNNPATNDLDLDLDHDHPAEEEEDEDEDEDPSCLADANTASAVLRTPGAPETNNSTSPAGPSSSSSPRSPLPTTRSQDPATPKCDEASQQQQQQQNAQPPSRPLSSSSSLPSSSPKPTATEPEAVALPEEPTTPDQPPPPPPAFTGWKSSKIGPFVVLLLDEFCRVYGLHETAATLQRELEQLELGFPVADLWWELHAQCRSILVPNNKKQSAASRQTTVEKLISFCVSPLAHKAVFALEVASAHSPVQVCASPKQQQRPSATTGYSLLTAYQQMKSPIVRPSQRAAAAKDATPSPPPPPLLPLAVSSEPQEAAAATAAVAPDEPASSSPQVEIAIHKKKKKRKAKPAAANGTGSTTTSTTGLGDHQHYHQPLAPGTYGELVLVQSHQTNLKRDLTFTRLVERELRAVRLEKISSDPKRQIQKKLGFRTLSPSPSVDDEDAQHLAKQKLKKDRYAAALVLEKYGCANRHACGLCQLSFLQYNLPYKVSFQCIMDVHEQWGYTPPDKATSFKYKPPRCYDAVRVCRMCAQIVFQHTKQLQLQPQEPQPRPRLLSRKHRQAKSMAALLVPAVEEAAFCSDPYALPPLLGDDVYDHRDANNNQQQATGSNYPLRRGARGGIGGGGGGGFGGGHVLHDHHHGELRDGVKESPAKAIIYSQQITTAQFMSTKEWDVINPEKSSMRSSLESSVANVSHPAGQILAGGRSSNS